MAERQLREFGTRAEELLELPDFADIDRRGHELHRRRQAIVVGLTACVLAVVGSVTALSLNHQAAEPVGPVSPHPSPTAVEPQKLPSGTEDPIQPGTYAVPFSGWGDIPPEVSDLRAVVAIPAGFMVDQRSTMVEIGSSPRHFGFWTVDEVATDFCAGPGPSNPFTNPGPTVADLASALAGQPQLRGTDPVPVTIGGHDGLYVELTKPASGCPGTVLWTAPRVLHAAYHDRFVNPGDVARFWILDVGGDRVVIDTIHPADASDDEVAQLTHIVESATFMTVE